MAHGISLLLAVLYAAEVKWPLGSTQPNVLTASVDTLVGFGGLTWGQVVDHGELYRLVPAPLLHASVSHIALNIYALLLASWLLERVIGRA